MGMGSFLAELKRRHVYRAGGAYAVAAFGLIEIVSNVTPMLDLPAWLGRALILILIVGFPLTLFTAWMIEGKPAEGAQTPSVSKLDYVLAGALVLVAGLLVYQQVSPARDTALLQKTVATATPAEGVSIAVLPFVNLSSDKEQEFFSDGMTEEITSALAKVKGLKVVGRTSAFEFKGQNKNLQAIGQSLHASHLLEGTVRKVGSRVRITGQLIRADDGTHIWTENYDRELTDIFATQDDIARAIAVALQAPLGLRAGESLVAARAIDPESYQLYLRSKALFRARGTGKNPLSAAAGLLEKVVEKEPGYAPAWALLAAVYSNAPQERLYQDGSLDERRALVDQFLTKAEAAGRRAIALDPNSADAYAGAANARVFRGSYVEMEDLYRQALKIDPNNPDALHGLSQQLGGLGKRQEAKALRGQLMVLEPLVPQFNRDWGRLLAGDGQAEAALAVLQALPSDYLQRAENLARVYASMGRYQAAADVLLGAPTGAFRPSEAESAARLLRRAPQTVPSAELPDLPAALGFSYLYVGATDRFVKASLEGLQRQVDTGYRTGFGVVVNDRAAGPVRATERFKALVRKAGLVDYWRARGWPDVCRPVGAEDFECS